MQAKIEHTRLRDYERFEENRRFEEMTDIAERLGYPIDTTIYYEMRGGEAYALSDTRDRPFHDQTRRAYEQGREQFVGDQSFEQERLRLEHEEALMVDAFGRGELDGDVLIKYSKVPDSVVDGKTSITGYRRDLLRSFVRVYHKTDNGIACRLFTLDQNNPGGTRAVSELLGIDASRASEVVLADHALITLGAGSVETADFVDELVGRAKLVYDDASHRSSGERTYAGSRYVDKQNAMNEIANRSWLIDQHMKAIDEIIRVGRGEAELEDMRQRTAAAIKLSASGVDVASAGDSAVATEVATGNYDRECATATVGMNQAAAESEHKWSYGQCRSCLYYQKVGPCSVCRGCESLSNAGVDLAKYREQNLRIQKEQAEKTKRATARKAIIWSGVDERQRKGKALHDSKMIKLRYGEAAEVRTTITIGGSYRQVYDRYTDEVLA